VTRRVGGVMCEGGCEGERDGVWCVGRVCEGDDV
jgi:hypothetical protein